MNNNNQGPDFNQPDNHIDDKALFKKCYNHAIKLLAARDYSEFKMRKKLNDKGFEAHHIDDVIDQIIEKKYLREDLYIEARIKGFIFKGYSPSSIVQRLSSEYCHTTQEEIENIMYERGTSSQAVLDELIEKKLRLDYDYVSNKEKLKNKTLRYAIGRGFDYGSVKESFEKIITTFEMDS